MPELAHLEPGERLAVIQKCQSKIIKRPAVRWATLGFLAVILGGLGVLGLSTIGEPPVLPLQAILAINATYWLIAIFTLITVRDRVIRKPLEAEVRDFLKRVPRFKTLAQCPVCEYDQRGTQGVSCPECGHACVGSGYVD